MAKGVKHYLRNGTEWKGSMHKMANGVLHTGKTHTKNSKRLYHFKDLSDRAKKKARPSKMAGGSVRKNMKKGGSTPSNPSLYSSVKSEAKAKFDVYPSAYANAWLVKTYKKRGGGYKS